MPQTASQAPADALSTVSSPAQDERFQTAASPQPAEDFSPAWQDNTSWDQALVDLDRDLLDQSGLAPMAWRDADLDPEVAEWARALARLMFRANDSERAEIRGLTQVCFRHAVGAALAGVAPDLKNEPEDAAAQPWPDQDAGSAPQLQALVARHSGLPGEQPLVRGVVESVAHPLSSAARVARAVSADPLLASLVLRLVNSPMFGLGSPIVSLERAVTFVGLAEVQALALAVAALRVLSGSDEDLLQRAWRRGVTCGVAARLLAKRLRMSGEGLLATGMLHVVGDLALERRAPTYARMARALADRDGVSLDTAQRRILGFDAAELGGELLDAWQVSGRAADLVRNQHRPHLSTRPDLAAILHLAGIMAHILDLSDNGRVPAPRLDVQAWCALCLPVPALSQLAGRVLDERFGLLRALRI